MLRKIFVALICVVSPAAMAATGDITYNRPTVYSDGAPLPAAAITGYEFVCAAGTTAGVVCTTLNLPGSALGGTMTIAVPSSGGTACVSGRTFVGASASVPSNIACKTFAAVPPGPPTNVVIAVVIGVATSPAYGYSATNKRIAEPAGFVAVGKPCTGACLFTFRGECYRKVARSDVQWWIAARDRIAAACRSGSVVAV